MFDDDVPAEVRSVLVVHNFHDPSIEHAKYVIVRHERGFFAFKVVIRGAVRENDAGRPAFRRDLDRCDITAAVEAFSAITCPTRLAVISIHARPRKKLLRRIQEKMIQRRPPDLQGCVAR